VSEPTRRLCVSLVFVDEEIWIPYDPDAAFTAIQEACAYLETRDPAFRWWRGRDPLLLEVWPDVLEGPGYRRLLGEVAS
jgi:hypothetical protein